MKTIYLEIEDDMYEKVVAILKKLRGIKIKNRSISPQKVQRLLQSSHINPFKHIDPLAYQHKIQDEGDRCE